MRRGDRLRLRCEAERATADSRISKGVDGSGALGSGEAGSGVPLAARRRKWAEGREASQSEATVWGRGAGVAPGAMRRCVWGQLSPTLGQVTVSKGNARVPEFSHRGHLHQCEKVPPPAPPPKPVWALWSFLSLRSTIRLSVCILLFRSLLVYYLIG